MKQKMLCISAIVMLVLVGTVAVTAVGQSRLLGNQNFPLKSYIKIIAPRDGSQKELPLRIMSIASKDIDVIRYGFTYDGHTENPMPEVKRPLFQMTFNNIDAHSKTITITASGYKGYDDNRDGIKERYLLVTSSEITVTIK